MEACGYFAHNLCKASLFNHSIITSMFEQDYWKN